MLRVGGSSTARRAYEPHVIERSGCAGAAAAPPVDAPTGAWGPSRRTVPSSSTPSPLLTRLSGVPG